jgi:hypothetical protein
MHLPTADIDRYLSRDLDERTLTTMDAQVSVSLPWTELLAQRAMEQAGWERRGLLGRLVRVEHRGEASRPQAQPKAQPEQVRAA